MRTIDAHSAPRADFVTTLAAGLAVLREFTPARPEFGVGEIARNLSWDKRRTQRLMSTLLVMGWLEQDHSSRRYRPGVAVLDLGVSMLDSLEERSVARPHLADLAVRIGCSVNLAVRQAQDAVMVECLRSDRDRVGLLVGVGDRRPMHLSSMGKAMLARLPEDELDQLLDSFDYGAGTQFAVRSRDELETQLDRVRTRGFAVMDQETVVGVRSVGVALATPDDNVSAALNVAVAIPLMTVRQLETHVAPAVLETAATITAQLTEPVRPSAVPKPTCEETS